LAGKRLRIFAWICLGWGLVLVLRLVHLQVVDHDKYVKHARSQQVRNVEVQAPRGVIHDRNDEPFAISVEVDTVAVNPKKIPDTALAADLLSRHLSLDPKQLRVKLETAKAKKRGFLYIKRKMTAKRRRASAATDWIGWSFAPKRSGCIPRVCEPHMSLEASTTKSVATTASRCRWTSTSAVLRA
jgi:cell division protein FtsI/penicillin-binding protein 2